MIEIYVKLLLLIMVIYQLIRLSRIMNNWYYEHKEIKSELAELQIYFAKHLQEHSERNVKFNRIMEKINNNQL